MVQKFKNTKKTTCNDGHGEMSHAIRDSRNYTQGKYDNSLSNLDKSKYDNTAEYLNGEKDDLKAIEENRRKIGNNSTIKDKKNQL